MESQRLADLIADGMDRRQRGHRLLEDDRDTPATDRSHLRAVVRHFYKIDNLAVEPGIGEQDLSTGDETASRQDAKNCLTDHRLSRAGFSNQGHGRSRSHAERDTGNSADEAAGRRKTDVQVADGEKIPRQAKSPAGSCIPGWECKLTPRAAKFARVTALSVNPRDFAALADLLTSSAKPLIRLSRRTLFRPERSSSCIQPSRRSRRVE